MTKRNPYILRTNQDMGMIPWRVAALIDDDLRQLRLRLQVTDHEAWRVLDGLHQLALEWRTSVSGSAVADTPEVAPKSEVVAPSEAADLLNMTDRAVRMACEQGRLRGEKVAGRWIIRRTDLEHFRATRPV